MLLERIRTENFRWSGSLELRLGATTLLFGEAASGKAVVDALAVALGLDADAEGFALLATDFPPNVRDGSAALRIRLDYRGEVGSQRDSRWPRELDPALSIDERERPSIHFEVSARMDPDSGSHQLTWSFCNAAGHTLPEAARPATLRALRETFAGTVIRGGLTLGNESLRREQQALRVDQGGLLDVQTREEVRELYRQLLAARGVLHEFDMQSLFERVRDFALASLVDEVPPWLGSASSSELALQGTPQRAALILLVGAAIEANVHGHGRMSGWPILVIEDPEAHLHPMVQSSVWALLQLVNIQKLVTTNSGTLLADAPLPIMRRIAPRGDRLQAFGLQAGTLSDEELRRVSYHVQVRRGLALFARSWLLIEGETEAWMMPGLAKCCGYDLAIEGVFCIEFAQCGVKPLVKLANDLGIEWHLLVDGDEAGAIYEQQALPYLGQPGRRGRITKLAHRDVEQLMWSSGFSEIFRRGAWGPDGRPPNGRRAGPALTIKLAVQNTSKPYLVLKALHMMQRAGAPEPPALLRQAVRSAVALARQEPTDKEPS